MVKHSIKKKLVPLGYLKKHPTGNNMTYEVTKKCMIEFKERLELCDS